MKLGINAPMWSDGGAPLTGEYLADAARRIEATGFDSIWIADTLNRGYVTVDPLIAASAVAMVTNEIEIGTAVLQVGRHNGVDLAHRLATVAMVSEGRFTLGAGAGSTETDFTAVGADFGQRFSQMRNNLDVIQRLMSGEEVDGVDLHPWPQTIREPSIVIGSWAGSKWIEQAAKHYDGWMGSTAKTPANVLLDGLAAYRSHRGQRAIAANLRVDLTHNDTATTLDRPLDLRCDPGQAAERLELLAEAGFDEAIVTVFDHNQAHLDQIRSLLDH